MLSTHAPVRTPQFGLVGGPAAMKRRVEVVASELRAIGGQSKHLPVDLDACARALGVSVVHREMRPGLDGRTFFSASGPRIEISTNQEHARQRFSLAHELAHLCFQVSRPYVADERWSPRGNALASSREEHLCNQIAAALLIPRTHLRRAAGALPRGRESCSQLAAMFGVSMATMGRYLGETKLWSLVIAQLRPAAGEWRLERIRVMLERRLRHEREARLRRRLADVGLRLAAGSRRASRTREGLTTRAISHELQLRPDREWLAVGPTEGTLYLVD